MKSINKLIDKYVIANLKLYGNCVIKKELYGRIDEVLTYLKKEFDLDCEIRVECKDKIIRAAVTNKPIRTVIDDTYILEVKR